MASVQDLCNEIERPNLRVCGIDGAEIKAKSPENPGRISPVQIFCTGSRRRIDKALAESGHHSEPTAHGVERGFTVRQGWHPGYINNYKNQTPENQCD